jgi:hypothetical protein
MDVGVKPSAPAKPLEATKTMMFRKLYWVTEQIEPSGKSKVTGVYTSIPDLIRHGLRWTDQNSGGEFRLTLTKLDCAKEPLGCWTSPKFKGLESDLQQFVKTDEFSQDQCNALSVSLGKFVKVGV